MHSNLLEALRTIKDPRHSRNLCYPLDEILFLCICSVVSGAEGWSAISQFGRTKLTWFREFLPYHQGIPNEDTIAWVLGRLNVKAFESCFVQWVNTVAGQHTGEIIAIDGKTARRSYDRRQGKNALHVVSAWACQQRLSLGQLSTDEKSNEITAIPQLLQLLKIKGALITIDAMGCQKAIAQQIKAQKADYILALKGNQGSIHEAVVDYFGAIKNKETLPTSMLYRTTTDSGHGRVETRHYYLTDDLCTLPDLSGWVGLTHIGCVRSHRYNKTSGKETIEYRYYLSSINDVEGFAEAVRSHWGVENQLHWVLDMVFREDESRIRSGHTPAIFNSLRQFANNLLRNMDTRLSIKARRFQAAIDDQFRTQAILGK